MVEEVEQVARRLEADDVRPLAVVAAVGANEDVRVDVGDDLDRDGGVERGGGDAGIREAAEVEAVGIPAALVGAEIEDGGALGIGEVDPARRRRAVRLRESRVADAVEVQDHGVLRLVVRRLPRAEAGLRGGRRGREGREKSGAQRAPERFGCCLSVHGSAFLRVCRAGRAAWKKRGGTVKRKLVGLDAADLLLDDDARIGAFVRDVADEVLLVVAPDVDHAQGAFRGVGRDFDVPEDDAA